MNSIMRPGWVVLAAVIVWSASDQVAHAAYQPPAADETKAEKSSTTWSWLKKRASQLQSAAKRRVMGTKTAESDGETQATDQPGRVGWTFHDIDARQALDELERFGLKLPVSVAGRLTLRVRVDVPWRHMFTAKDYRLYGFIRSDHLTVAGIELDELRADLSFMEGLLRLEQLQLTTPDLAAENGKLRLSGSAEAQLEPRGDLTARLDFERLSLSRVLEQAGQAAGAASGEAAGHAEAKAPVDRMRELAAWNAEGRVNVKQLNAPGVRHADLQANLRFEQGAVSLSKLTLHSDDSPLSATGSAKAQLQPLGDLTAELSLEHVDVESMASAAPQLTGMASGRLAVQAETSVALEHVQDAAAWQADATLTARDLRLAGLPPAHISTVLKLADGTLTASRFDGDAEFFHLEGSARVEVASPFKYSATLQLTSSRLSRINELHADLRLPVEIGGRVGASAVLKGALEPNELSAHGGVNARDLRIAGVAVERLELRYQADSQELQLHPLNAGLSDGTVSASVVVPFAAESQLRAGIRWDRLQIGPLVQRFAALPEALRARATGTLQARLPLNRLGDPSAWDAQGRADVDQLNFGAVRGASAGADISLKRGILEFRKLTATANPMRLDGSLRLGVAAPYDYAFKLTLGNADLAMFNSLPAAARPPWRLAGRAGVSADFSGSLEPFKAIGKGAVLGRQLRADGLRVDSLRTDFWADERRFGLSGIDAELYQGKATGQLTMPIAADASGAISLRWNRLQAGNLLRDLQIASSGPIGRSEGRVNAVIDDGKFGDFARWKGDAKASIEDVHAYGWAIRRAAAQARLNDGALQLTELSVRTTPRAGRKPATIDGSGQVKLTAPYDFEARLKLAAFDLEGIQGLPESLRPTVDVGGEVNSSLRASGTLDPLHFEAQGGLSASGLLAAGAKIDSLALRFAVDEKSARLSDLDAQLYDGSVRGAATLPLGPTAAGSARTSFQNLDLGRLLADVGKLPVKAQGVCQGKLELEVPPGRLEQIAQWELHASLDAPEIDVNAIRIGKVRARADYVDESLDYEAKGDLLSGAWQLSGVWSSPSGNERNGVNQGQLQIQSVQLGRLGEILRQLGKMSSLSGSFNARLDYRHDEQTGWPIGDGTFEIDSLRANDVAWSNRMRGSVRLARNRIAIEELTGSIAGGVLRTSGVFYLSRNQRGRFRVSLSGADLKRLISAWAPDMPDVNGLADADLLVFVGGRRPWQTDGAVSIRNGEFAGASVGDVRVPLTGRFNPASGNAELHIRNASAQIAFGRLTASGSARLSGHLQLKGRGKFANLDLRQLLRGTSVAGRFGTGKVTGDFTLAGRNVRSLDDLTGTLQAKLRNTQAAAVPLMQTLQSYVAGGLTGSSRFGTGDLRAHLSRGVVRVERFSLSSPSVQFYADGDVALSGRLNLNVTVNTGQMNTTPAILLLAARLSVLVSPPIGLLLEANQFLANQVVYLEVTGTIRSPTIRVRALPLLQEEAIRFFLLSAPLP